MAYGGDIKSLTFNNDEVGSGIFKPKAGEANTLEPGGLRSNDDTSAITSDGELIVTQNMKAGYVQILIANDANVRKDLEKASQLAGSSKDTTWTVTLINGAIYKGKGIVVGDLLADLDKATLPLKVVAPTWTQQ